MSSRGTAVGPKAVGRPSAVPKSSANLDFSLRESAEIIIGLSGAIGSGMEHVVSNAHRLLEERGYQVIVIKLSRFIEGMLDKNLVPNWDAQLNARNRLERLQLAGNELRVAKTTDFLAELAIAVISNDRLRRAKAAGIKVDDDKLRIEDIVPGRVAYLVDQVKHPDEVLLLRKVYGQLFYLIGVLAGEKQRIKNLKEILAANEVTDVIERDKQDEVDHGQQLDKTLKLSDFFIRNNLQNDQSLIPPIKRFLALIHGETARSPTKAEYAMYAAYSAGLRSACLSRQVGASITDEEGNVIATGCNDVPKAGGGLYSEDDLAGDHRCIHLRGGVCFNDRHKDELGSEIEKLMVEGGVKKELAAKIAVRVRKTTALRDLLEFSRSVHAEMDALVTIARKGGPSVVRGSLYTTTFPCHNCARHIIAAGITRVFYIEPYEKSLALKLHDDAIAPDGDGTDGKVSFLHFEGVAPRQYQSLFLSPGERKDNGVALRQNPTQARKSRVQYLDSYRDLETKVIENLVDIQGLTTAQIADLSGPATS